MRKSTFIYNNWLLVVGTFLFISCQKEKISSPRPHAYPRIEFQEHSFQSFDEDYCPMTFEYAKGTTINKKRFFFNENPDNECWFNISIDDFDATIYFTYHPVKSEDGLESLIDDAFTMVSKHNTKATSRSESRLNNNSGLSGLLFEIGGPVASPLQFYITDSDKHFLRASLYYNENSANDSLQIVTDYLKEDVMHIISTLNF